MQRWVSALSAPIALVCAMSCVLSCSAQSTNVLVHVVDAAPTPLASVQASIATGRAIFGDRASGNCALCHRIASLDVPFQGDVGPDLTAVGQRLTAAQLRFRIVDASRLNPGTVMPPYFRTEGLNSVAEERRGNTVLTADQVEHLVAYLASLTEQVK